MAAAAEAARLAAMERDLVVDAEWLIVNPQPDAAAPLAAGHRRVRGYGALGAEVNLCIVPGNVGPIADLPFFDIRNGNPADVRDLFIRESIPLAYHWVPVSGIRPEDAMAHTEVFIRVARAHLEANAPATMEENARRHAAILLGTVRATVTTYYTVTQDMLNPNETAPAMLRFVDIAGDPPTRRLEAVAGTTNVVKARLFQAMTLTETELNVMKTIVRLAVAIPAVQGYSLIMCNHHYLTTNPQQSRRAFDAMEKEHWGDGPTREWFETNADVTRDLLWHKSTHPIVVDLKIRWAQSMRVKMMIHGAGNGSGCARLPALEPEMRAASGAIVLLTTVGAVLSTFGGNVDMTALTNAYEWVSFYSIDHGNPARPANMPADIQSRRAALAHLQRVLEVGNGQIAFCYGFYKAMDEREAMNSANKSTSSLGESFSLRRLENESPAAFASGRDNFGDFHAARMAARTNGEYKGARIRLPDV